MLALQTWVSPTIRGEGPPAREGHSAAVVGKRLFIFGGCGKSADNNNELYYNDLYILNAGDFPKSYCQLGSKLVSSLQDLFLWYLNETK